MTAAAMTARLSRRGALGGAAALSLGVLLGCSVGDRPDEPSPSGVGTSPGGAALDPESVAVVDAALASVLGQRVWLEALATTYPRLEGLAIRATAMHRAHEAFLAGLLDTGRDPVDPVPGPVPENRRDVAAAVLASFTAHEATVTELAIDSRDPALARALASIAAATAQLAATTGWGGAARTLDPPLPTGAGFLADSERAALQRVLQREHASLWWYGVLGARTSASGQPAEFELMQQGYQAHRAQRDQLDATLRALGVEPVAAAVAYPLPWRTRSSRQRTRAAREIEHGAAAAFSWLVAQIGASDATGAKAQLRRWAITALRNAAIRELVGQGNPENFPGADEIADR